MTEETLPQITPEQIADAGQVAGPELKHYTVADAEGEIVGGLSMLDAPEQEAQVPPGGFLIDGQFSPDTHYIEPTAGELCEYTEDQARAKRTRPVPYSPIAWRWSNAQMSWVLREDAPMGAAVQALASAARAQRDQLLTASDWTQQGDSGRPAAWVEAWRVYRRALRDITHQPGFPISVTWPQQPT